MRITNTMRKILTKVFVLVLSVSIILPPFSMIVSAEGGQTGDGQSVAGQTAEFSETDESLNNEEAVTADETEAAAESRDTAAEDSAAGADAAESAGEPMNAEAAVGTDAAANAGNGAKEGSVSETAEPAGEGGEELLSMPAGRLQSSASNGVRVTVSFAEGTFPEGTSLEAKAVPAAGIIGIAGSITEEDFEVLDAAAVDITFYNDGKEIQPLQSVSVSLSTGREVEGEVHEVVHVSAGHAELIGGSGSTSASFSADHFSIYGIIGGSYKDDSIEKLARYTYVFKDGDKTVDTQIVRNGETVSEPQAPASAEGKVFIGWSLSGRSDDLISFPLTAEIPEDETEDRTVTVDAVFDEIYYVTFFEDREGKRVLHEIAAHEGDVIITSDMEYNFGAYEKHRAITGWRLRADAPDSETAGRVTVKKHDIKLYPVISEVSWLFFDSRGGTPVDPAYAATGKTPAEPAAPTRSGYEFIGWYEDKECTVPYTFGQLTSDKTVYAGWRADTKVRYRVAHWKQNANDDGYTFAEMESMEAYAGENASYVAKNYEGFELNTEKSNETVVVDGHGTTVKNVYYDRKMYPLEFWVKVKTGGDSWWSPSTYKWEMVLSGSFRYEQDTQELWDKMCEQYPGYGWYIGKDSTISYTHAPAMEPAGGGKSLIGFGGIYVYGRKTSETSYIYYLDYADRTTRIKDDFAFGKSDWHFTDEDHIKIPGWTFKEEGDVRWEGRGADRKYIGRLYYTRNSYGVKFITNDGKAPIEKSGIKYEATLEGYAPSEYNSGITHNFDGITKIFAGWYDNPVFQGDPVYFRAMTMPALDTPGDSLVFYAKWEPATCCVSFDLDGGSINGSSHIMDEYVESGERATEPVGLISKEGYIFGGWRDRSTGELFHFDQQITEEVHLVAAWHSTPVPKYIRIVYDPGEYGTFDKTDDELYHDGGEAPVLGQPSLTDSAKENHLFFKGWKIGTSDRLIHEGLFVVKGSDAGPLTQMRNANANGGTDEAEDEITAVVLTLTAQYGERDDIAKVRYHSNYPDSDTEEVHTESVMVNSNFTVAGLDGVGPEIDPKDSRLKLVGWKTASEKILYPGETAAAGRPDDNDLYAVWEIEEQTNDGGDEPDEPEKPKDPETALLVRKDPPGGPAIRTASVESSKGVQTGDSGELIAWLSALAATGGLLTAILRRRKTS